MTNSPCPFLSHGVKLSAHRVTKANLEIKRARNSFSFENSLPSSVVNERSDEKVMLDFPKDHETAIPVV